MDRKGKGFSYKTRNWASVIILSIFVNNIEYVNMFENIILNGVVNIVFGIITIVLTCLFFKEKGWTGGNSQFNSFLTKTLLILGSVNSFYHVGYAVGRMIALV